MPQPSPILQALLVSLTQAVKNGSLPLDSTTLQSTSAAPLLELFSDQLQITSFTLNNAQLPAAVTDDTLTVSGTQQDVTLTLLFQDVQGVVATQALFQAAATDSLQTQFSSLPADFFSGIVVDGATASVTVPGLASALSFASPVYGITGLITNSSGLITTSIAPRVDGQVSPPSGAKGLSVEVETTTSGYRIAPTTNGWAFTDFGWLMSGIDVTGAFPSIIPTQGLGFKTFDLNLYPQQGSLSSLTLDVADIADPTKPLWSAMNGKIELTDVKVTIALTYGTNNTLALAGSGSIEGDFALGSLILQAQIPFPLTGVWSLTAFPNLTINALTDIATLLDSSGQLNSLMPAGLADIGAFTFTYLRVAVNASTMSLIEFSFALESAKSWSIIPNVLELSALRIAMTINGTPAITGSVVGQLTLPKASQVIVSFGRSIPDAPWRLDVVSPVIALPSLGDLAGLSQSTDLASMVKAGGLDQLHFVMTGLNIGLTISPTKLTNLGLTLQLANASDPLSTALDWELIPGVLTLTQFEFGFQMNWGATSTKNVFGRFALNGLDFSIKFAQSTVQGANNDALIAEYVAEGNAGTVDVKDLITSISPSVGANVPAGLEIDLADAMLAYFNYNGVKKYLFAMDISVEFPLTDLPLIGKSLPASSKAGIKNLKVVVTSAALSLDEVNFVNNLSDKPVLPLPPSGTTGDAIPSGFSMVAEIELGELSILMTSPPAKPAGPASPALTSGALSGPVASVKSTGSRATTIVAASLAAGPPTDPVMWINVQKTFGPVAIQKVGFSYSSGSLFVVSNLSLAVGGLEIDLIGIGIGSPIKNPSPRFTIQGISVSYVQGPIAIMGGMLGTLDPVNFVGALSVKVPAFSLTALAGYAQLDGHPSFFLYGVLNIPLGGPPPFFVTGIAAGMGFNRKLVIPDISGVATFPLVQWATGTGTPAMDPNKPIGDQVTNVLTKLSQAGIVAPSVGDYWFALGVMFTSFELISSFALITVSLGTDVEVALLGLSTLTVPPMDPVPVAEVQLALEVSFSTRTGLVAVAAQLTNNSYVFSKSCRLTGGFAFYMWFKGDHAGETVVSLGGYNPNFDVPTYYPVVPRLGLNWQVIPSLTITGGLYFAVTSNAIMAGGKLSAVWAAGPIRAWFIVWADFLIVFKPFRYYIDSGIDLGASFTIDFGLFSLSLTIHIGVDLAIWGPEFAGKATVDLSIISFTIKFNNQDQKIETSIPWPQFVQELLPSQPTGKSSKAVRRGRLMALAAADDPPPPPPAVVQINVVSGLIRTLAPINNNPCYLISAETFQCAVALAIPIKSVTFATDPGQSGYVNLEWAPDAQQPLDASKKPIPVNTDFGVGPANLSPAEFQPALTLSMASAELSVLQAIRQLSNAPKALWEQKTFDAHGVPIVSPKTGLTQASVPNALVGLTLVPYVADPDFTLPVPLSSLLFSLDDNIQPFAWSAGVAPTTGSFPSAQTVANTIIAAPVVTTRNALLAALAAQGVVVNTAVNVSGLAQPANNDIQAPPRLRLLGEQAHT